MKRLRRKTNEISSSAPGPAILAAMAKENNGNNGTLNGSSSLGNEPSSSNTSVSMATSPPFPGIPLHNDDKASMTELQQHSNKAKDKDRKKIKRKPSHEKKIHKLHLKANDDHSGSSPSLHPATNTPVVKDKKPSKEPARKISAKASQQQQQQQQHTTAHTTHTIDGGDEDNGDLDVVLSSNKFSRIASHPGAHPTATALLKQSGGALPHTPSSSVDTTSPSGTTPSPLASVTLAHTAQNLDALFPTLNPIVDLAPLGEPKSCLGSYLVTRWRKRRASMSHSNSTTSAHSNNTNTGTLVGTTGGTVFSPSGTVEIKHFVH